MTVGGSSAAISSSSSRSSSRSSSVVSTSTHSACECQGDGYAEMVREAEAYLRGLTPRRVKFRLSDSAASSGVSTGVCDGVGVTLSAEEDPDVVLELEDCTATVVGSCRKALHNPSMTHWTFVLENVAVHSTHDHSEYIYKKMNLKVDVSDLTCQGLQSIKTMLN